MKENHEKDEKLKTVPSRVGLWGAIHMVEGENYKLR